MTAIEIVGRVGELIEGWKAVGVETLRTPRYEGQFFRLCREAYRSDFHLSGSPNLSADGLLAAVRERWSLHEDPRRLHGLREVCAMWSEWLDALERSRLLTRDPALRGDGTSRH